MKTPSSSKSTSPPPPYTPSTEQTPLIHRHDPYSLEFETEDENRAYNFIKCFFLASFLLFVAYITALFFFSWARDALEAIPPVVNVSVAIIGAGPAGVSTAYTLATQFKDRKDVKLNITIFEQSSKIGGRMAISPRLGETIVHAEDVAGGCLGHNAILRKRASSILGVKFGMSRNKLVTGRTDSVGFWNGKDMQAEMKRPRGEIGLGLWIKLVWMYGPSFWRAGDLPTGTMRWWRGALEDEEGEGEEVGDLVGGAVRLGAVERLEKNGVGGDYVRDVLRSQVRRQSGCEVEAMSDLALSMALEREDEGLCVDGEGGRFAELMERVFGASKAEAKLGTKVTGLKKELIREGKESWILKLENSDALNKESTYGAFDKVIIAAPWNTSSLLSPDVAQIQEQIVYHPLWLTFISSKSKLNSSTFGFGSSPSQVIPIQSSTLPQHFDDLQEISHLRDIYHASPSNLQNSSLYRVLSTKPVAPETLSLLWEEDGRDIHTEYMENAYPMLYPRSDGFSSFKVSEELWWTSGIEAVASNVDAAWTMGEKVGAMVGRDIESDLKK